MSNSNFVVGETQPITNSYQLGAQLGQPGQFGRAVLATSKTDKAKRAVKIISKSKFRAAKDRQRHFKQLRDEIRIMTELSHPNIIKFYEVFESNTELFLVMECCSGGELFDRIKAQQSGSYSEQAASRILKQILEGVNYMHLNKIAHCDLKPDNFLFLDSSEESDLKIIDFGMSKHVERREYLHSFRGTPYYVAPEVLQGQYAEHCDMWSVGVIMFVMIFGFPPFSGQDDNDIFNRIEAGFCPEVKKGYGAWFPAKMPVSDGCRDLIARMLDMDHAMRITAAEALAHPWFNNAPDQPLEVNVLSNLLEFTGKTKLKAACAELFSNVLSESELESLKASFAKIDANGDGSITLEELKGAVAAGVITGTDAINVEKLLNAADIDGDGVLSYQELLATAVHKKLTNKEERLWNAFCMLDVDGDGSITVAEIQSVLGTDDAKAMLAEIDKNGDGVVNYDEFMAMYYAKS